MEMRLDPLIGMEIRALVAESTKAWGGSVKKCGYNSPSISGVLLSEVSLTCSPEAGNPPSDK